MFLSKYNTARHIYIPLVKRAVVDHAVSADWTPAAGDVKISKDGGAAANVTNLPVAIAMGNSALWDFSLTATELSCAQAVITIADSATKAVEDSAFIVETYGNSSAQHAFDLGTATVVASSVSALAANVITASSINADAITAAKIADGAIDAATFAADTGLKPVRSNTAAAGAATTITLDASASAVDDFYKNDLIYLTGGTGAGQGRFITGYVGSTKVATVATWATNPDNTSTFAILPSDGTSAPTAAVTAAAVWDLARAGHATAGTFGEGVASVQGSVTGSVASVTGAVGSVTGAVGSVTGNVGGNVVGSVASVTGNVGGNVVGSVASVTGNVGGNVVGSVASVTANVNADVKKINGTTVNGNGSGTPWGP